MHGTSSGRSAQIGSPTLGLGAGLRAARIDARPGLAIGVGGRPSCMYVFYGVSMFRCSLNGTVSGSSPACCVPYRTAGVDGSGMPMPSRL